MEQGLTFTLAALLLCGWAKADSFYVWSNDGTIRKFDSSGAAQPYTTTNLTGYNGPTGLALDNAGNLYSACPGESEIRRFSADGTGRLVGGFDSISGLVFDHNGFLYATAPNYSTLLMGLGNNQTTISNLTWPVSLAFDRAGSVYVANCPGPSYIFPVWPHTYDNTIQKFSADLAFVETFTTNLNGPWGLAFDTAGSLFVANSGTNGNLSNTIMKFAPDGVGSVFASATNGLDRPTGLAFDSATNLYVANAGNGTIERFTPDGKGSVFVSGLNSPMSIAVFPGLAVWSATPIVLHVTIMTNEAFGFTFASSPGLSFAVLSTTNLASPHWVSAGGATETSAGIYGFSGPQVNRASQIYYRVLAQ